MTTFIDFIYPEVGEVGVVPRVGKLHTDATYNELTAPGFLDAKQFFVSPSDYILAVFTGNGKAMLQPSINGGIITLVPVTGGEVNLPVVANNLASFADTNGVIKDSGLISTNVVSAVGTLTAGRVVKVNNNRVIEQSTRLDDRLMQSAFDNPDININIVRVDVTVTAASLGAGAVAILVVPAGTQYRVLDLWINHGGTNFSGGGGDRSLSIFGSGGGIAYTIIPAAVLQSLVNARWGSTQVPLPTTAPMNSVTPVAQTIAADYTGGSTDYTTGFVVVTGIFERVT